MRLLRRRRPGDAFLEGIRPELETLKAPEPTDALRARILSSRAAGACVILPPDRVTTPRRRWVAPAIATYDSALAIDDREPRAVEWRRRLRGT